ncbi:hypothetical protein ACIBMX_49525 [Streptomyces phaeochromogenes]|uniref:hypothetical protein n=1 Tax=Streptomyces phaeochromogenes TaxID=1923 RepID=UPI0037898959
MPEAVAKTAESMVRSWRTPTGECDAEWDHAQAVRTAIDAFGQSVRWPEALVAFCAPPIPQSGLSR